MNNPVPGRSGDVSACTMEDVARAAGVHRTTVSLALRNHPRIPASTRKRIQDTAAKLNYRPNPLISLLMSSRATRHKPAWRGTLGILTTGPTADSWKQPNAYRVMFEGAQHRARELGWDLCPFWINDPRMPISRLNKMLQTRNIPGCIVAPLIGQDTLPEFQWDAFSVVTIGHSLQKPDLHRISNDYYHSMILALDQCRQQGFRRIGLALDQTSDDRVDHLWLAAYLMEQRLRTELANLEPLILQSETGASTVIRQWLKSEKPEVVICLPKSSIRQHIQRMPQGVSEKIRWVSLGCYQKGEADSGVYQNYSLIGAAAVDFLVNMVNHGERGIPEQSHVLLIKSGWNSGTTLTGMRTFLIAPVGP